MSVQQRNLWTNELECTNNYPKPQGKLPASSWLYKKELVPKDLHDFKISNIFNILTGPVEENMSNYTKNMASYKKE